MRKKISELESSLKEKEQVINSIIESFTYQLQPQLVYRNRWFTVKSKTTTPQNPKQNSIAGNNRFDSLCLNNVNYKDFAKEDENIKVSNPRNQQILKQQTTTLSLTTFLKITIPHEEIMNQQCQEMPNTVMQLDSEKKR